MFYEINKCIIIQNGFSQSSNFCCIVLDETTYYFTAFAIDQNNNIIDSQTLSITTDFWWHVTPNTLAYYKLETDWNDYSWNWNDMTATWISFANWVAVLNWNQRATIPNITWFKTICFRFKKTNDYNGMPISQWNTNWYIQLRTNGFSAWWSWWWNFNKDFTAWWSTPSNVWRLCVVTQTTASDQSGSWSMKFYLSDFWWVSWIRQYDQDASHYLNRSITKFWWSWNTSAPYALIAEMSKFIVEKSEWSFDDIVSYYNKTKSKYWY